MIWTDSSVPFPFGKGSSGVLANCSLCGTETTFSFSACPVCSSFSAEAVSFCKFFAGLGSTNKSAISFPFSSYKTLVLSLPLCALLHFSFYLKLCGRNCLLCPPVLSGYNGFSWGTTWLMSWPDRACYLHPLQSRVVSYFCIHSSLFSDYRHTVSSKFFDTLVPSISTKKFVPPCHACCVLSCLCCNKHSLLLSSCFSRMGRIENPFCSTCRHLSQDSSHLILHCPATNSLHC